MRYHRVLFFLCSMILFIGFSGCSRNIPNLIPKPDDHAETISVIFRVDDSKQNIKIDDRQTNQTLFNIPVGVPINNFGLNHNHTLLTVLTASDDDSVWLYHINKQQFIHKLELSEIPNFVAFSQDNTYLALASEKSPDLWIIDLASLDDETIELPGEGVESMKMEEDTGKLLVRTTDEIVKVGFTQMGIVERHIKIPILFAGDTMWIEPVYLCSIMEVEIDHPLYTTPTPAMEPQGLTAIIQSPLKSPSKLKARSLTYNR